MKFNLIQKMIASSAIALLLISCSPKEQHEKLADSLDNKLPELSQRVKTIYGELIGCKNLNELRASSEEKLEGADVYITNFSSGGFLLYGVDDHESIKVYGISSNGSLSSSDTIQTPQLRTILEGAIQLQAQGKNELDDTLIPLPPGGGGGGYNPPLPQPDLDIYPKTKSRMGIKAVLHHYKPSTLPFSQREPFNNYIHKPYLGCANSALAAFLSHYRIPTKITVKKTGNVTYMDWDKLWKNYSTRNWQKYVLDEKDLSHQVAEMCNYIFYSHPRVWVIPDEEGTGVFPIRVRQFLEKMNFKTVYKDYHEDEILDYLSEYHRPVLMYGEASFWERHYWVIDGVLEFRYYVTHYIQRSKDSPWEIESTEDLDDRVKLIHCNWGWSEGKCNGYFYPQMLRPNIDPYPDDIWYPQNKSNKTEDYTRNAKAFYTYSEGQDLKWEWTKEE